MRVRYPGLRCVVGVRKRKRGSGSTEEKGKLTANEEKEKPTADEESAETDS